MADERDDKTVREEIERRAHERYRDRGMQHGADLDDWLAAEREVAEARSRVPAGRRQPAQAEPKPRRRRAPRS